MQCLVCMRARWKLIVGRGRPNPKREEKRREAHVSPIGSSPFLWPAECLQLARGESSKKGPILRPPPTATLSLSPFPSVRLPVGPESDQLEPSGPWQHLDLAPPSGPDTRKLVPRAERVSERAPANQVAGMSPERQGKIIFLTHILCLQHNSGSVHEPFLAPDCRFQTSDFGSRTLQFPAARVELCDLLCLFRRERKRVPVALRVGPKYFCCGRTELQSDAKRERERD